MATSGPREAKPRASTAETPIQGLFQLTDRTILITGAGGAMGLEVAGAILESGGDVICIDRAETPPLPELWAKTQRTAEKNQRLLWYYSCDITNADDVFATFDRAVSQTRHPLRGLVACAGISGGGPSTSFPIQQTQSILDVNVIGTFTCCQAIGREFQKHHQPGSVVLVASMSAHGSNKGVDTSIYNASKSAVVQLARSLAAEWGSRVGMPCVRVNSISPGYIKTRMTAKDLIDPKCEQAWSADNMLNRLSTADEYRGAAVFLLSEASSFVTGADIRIDGGHTAW